MFDISLHLFTISSQVSGGILLWGTMILSPHGALFSALLASTQDFAAYVQNYPPVGATIAFMLAETAGFLYLAYYVDSSTISKLMRQQDFYDKRVLESLDEDVIRERERSKVT